MAVTNRERVAGGECSATPVQVYASPYRDDAQMMLHIDFKDTEGSTFTWTGWLTENAWPIAERALKALGWDPAEHDFDLGELLESQSICKDAQPINIRWEREIVTYERSDGSGEATREEVSVKNIGGGRKHMEVEAAASMAKNMRAKLKMWSKNAAERPAGSTQSRSEKTGGGGGNRGGGGGGRSQGGRGQAQQAPMDDYPAQDDDIPF